MKWSNVWRFLTHDKQIKSTHSSDRFHWTNDLHQRGLICESHRDWGWSTTLASGSTHKGWLPIVLRKENDRNKIIVNVCENVPGRRCNTGRSEPGRGEGEGCKESEGSRRRDRKEWNFGLKKAGIRSNKKLVNSLEKASVKRTESRN